MTIDEFKEKLKDTKSKEHSALLTHVMGLIALSRDEMAKNYTAWDVHDKVFRGERATDKEDESAAAKGQPQKMIVQLTFSQVMTFVAFNIAVVTQNKRFFELEPTGTEDNPLREPMELVLERDLRRNTWQTHLVQLFLDIARFSIGCAEICWTEKFRKVKVTTESTDAGAFGVEKTETKTEAVDVPVFVGNRVFSISPYRFFPDTRLPLTRYQEGEFCGSEDMFSIQGLKGDDDVFNLDAIPKMTEKMYDGRTKQSRIDSMLTRANPPTGTDGLDAEGSMVKSGPVCVTKLCFDVIPKDFEVDGEAIGEEDYPVRFCCWYANDQTIIRFEEAYYLHGMFPYVCAQYLPDQHRKVNMGLAETCDQITSLITWLINAHVTSQRSMIEGKFLIDPAGVDIKSLESRSPYIFLKKNASQTGVDRYIKQFITQDTTQSFMQDASGLKGLLGEITGYNESMAGQYSSGRRSATQDRVVAQAGSARGKAVLGGIWDTYFEPCAKQLIANNRQEMDEETFMRIMGSTGTPEMFTAFKADPVAIASSEDFFVFDGTVPSEKAFLAQSLQEIVMMMMQNPQVAAIMGYGPEQFRAMIQDLYNLRGVTPSRLPAPQSPATPTEPANVLPLLQATQASNTGAS